MSRRKPLQEDSELAELLETEQQLLLRERECVELPRKLAQELKDRECTMPPLAEIEERKQRIQHEQIVSRGQVTNLLRDQNRSVVLLLLLIAATSALIWWGLKLMQG